MANFKIFNSINKNIIKKDYINMYKINSSIIDKEYLQNIDLIKKEDYAFEKYLNHYDKDEYDGYEDEYDGYEDEYDGYENKKVFNKYQIEKINFIKNSIELIIKENKNNLENEFDPYNNTQNIAQQKLQEFVFSLISKDVSNNSKELLMEQVNSFSFLDSNFAFKFLRIFDFDYAKYNKDSEKEIFDYSLLSDEQCLFVFNILNILIKDPNFLFNEKNSFYINNLVKKLDFHNQKSLNETMLVSFFENVLNSKKDTFLDGETTEFLFSKYTFINQDLNFKIVETIFNSPTNDQFISDFSLKDMLTNFSNKLDIDSKLKINKLVRDANLGTVCIDYINAFSALPKNKIYFSTLEYIFDTFSLEKKQVNLHLELVQNMILKDENHSLDLNILIHSLDFKDETVSFLILNALLLSNREKFNLTLNSVNVLFSKSPTFAYSSYNHFLSKLLIDETSEVNSNIINEHLSNKNNYLYVNNYVSVFINSIVLSDKTITLTEKTVLKLVNQFYLEKNVENDKIYSFLDSLINKKNIITSYSTINSFLKTLFDKNNNSNLLHLFFCSSILESNQKIPIEQDLFYKLIKNSLSFSNSITDISKYSFFKKFINYINNPIHNVSDENILFFFEKFHISNMTYFDDLLRLNDKNFNLVLNSFNKPILIDEKYDSQYEIQALISISQSNNVSPLKLSKIIEVIIENPTLSLTSKVAILLSLSPKYLDVLINSKTFINSLKKLTDKEKEMILKELNKPKDYISQKFQQNSILFQKIFSDDFKKDKLNSIFVPSLSNNIRYISSILKRSKDFEFLKEDQTALYSVLKTDSNNYKKVILDITKFSFFKKDRTEELQSFIDDIIIRKEIISNFSNINLNSSSIPQNEIISNIYKNIKFLIDFNFLDIKTSIIKDIDKLISFDLKSILFEYNIDVLKVITEKDTNFINSVNKQIEDLKLICLEQIHYQFTTMSVEEVKIDVAKINHDLLIEKNLEIDSNLILNIYNLKSKNKNIPTKLNTLLDKFFEIRLANFNGLYNYQVKLITNQMDSILNLFSLLILLPKEEQNKKINRDGLSSIDFFDINLSKIDSNLNEILESFKKISVLDKISLIRDTSIKEKSLSTIKTNSSGPK